MAKHAMDIICVKMYNIYTFSYSDSLPHRRSWSNSIVYNSGIHILEEVGIVRLWFIIFTEEPNDLPDVHIIF